MSFSFLARALLYSSASIAARLPLELHSLDKQHDTPDISSRERYPKLNVAETYESEQNHGLC